MVAGFLGKQLEDAASSATGNSLLGLASFLLFADSVMVKFTGFNLISLDLDWIKLHLSIGGLVLLVGAYVVIQVTIFPWLRVFIGLPMFLATEVVIHKFSKRFRRYRVKMGIRDEDFLTYAIVKNNSVAYEEYKRRKAEWAKESREAELSLGLFALVIVNFWISGRVPSVSQLSLMWIRSLPPVVFWFVAVTLALALWILLIPALTSNRFGVRYFGFFNDRLYDELKDFRELEQKPVLESEEA